MRLMRSHAYPSLSAIASANTRTRVRVRVSMLSSARAFNSDLASCQWNVARVLSTRP